MERHVRILAFLKGLNRLEFSWANTLIDPTSVEFRALTHADEVEVLDMRRNFSGDWSVKTETGYEKIDAHKVKFVLALKPHEKQEFSYQVTTKFGTNAGR